ncbi:hypothetical protein AXG93_4620s1200 [Marchantia polymorpha subsp. ruderalis]|uniref:Uncharacterized protein n=1 Tax=Marchantia polymorpha subsp. ruderalis TaxID=1480154 RepID=A0A176VZF8_MARPO|nr:hypothetical protein AXG93_4620s1200 [Marchantia polymorpha subsp. ruderalis]
MLDMLYAPGPTADGCLLNVLEHASAPSLSVLAILPSLDAGATGEGSDGMDIMGWDGMAWHGMTGSGGRYGRLGMPRMGCCVRLPLLLRGNARQVLKREDEEESVRAFASPTQERGRKEGRKEASVLQKEAGARARLTERERERGRGRRGEDQEEAAAGRGARRLSPSMLREKADLVKL